MKITIKSKIYLIIMIGMSIGNCFASQEYQAGGYGQLPQGVARLPIANLGYQSTVFQQTQTAQIAQQQEERDQKLEQRLAEEELLRQQQNLQKRIMKRLHQNQQKQNY